MGSLIAAENIQEGIFYNLHKCRVLTHRNALQMIPDLPGSSRGAPQPPRFQ